MTAPNIATVAHYRYIAAAGDTVLVALAPVYAIRPGSYAEQIQVLTDAPGGEPAWINVARGDMIYAPGDIVDVSGESRWLIVAGPSEAGCYAAKRVFAYKTDLSWLALAWVASIKADQVYDCVGTYPVPEEDTAIWGAVMV